MHRRHLICSILILSLLVYTGSIPAHADSVSRIYDRTISETAILIDADTGQVLFDKDMHKVMRPASITKIMTALLALENGEPDGTVVMSRNALRNVRPDAASIALSVGEELTLEQALYALSIMSAADAANGIADHISGTLEDFVKLMNERAAQAGALNTNFVNAHGMPDDAHLTTAYDMARIAMQCVKIPEFLEMFSARRYEMPATNKHAARLFENRNRMITGEFRYNNLIAGRTGWTQSSEHTLFTAARRGERTLICIVMKSPEINDKYRDTIRLFNFGFDEFKNISISIEEIEQLLAETDIGEMVDDIIIESEFSCLIPNNFSISDIEISYIIDNEILDNEDPESEDSENEDQENVHPENEDPENVHPENEDSSNPVPVKLLFSLNAPEDWQGFTFLGEVTAAAQLIDDIADDEPDPEEDIQQEPEDDREPETGELEAGEQETTAEIYEPLEITPEPVDNSTDKNKDYITQYPPEWVNFLTDVAAVLMFIIIIFCYFAAQRRKRSNNRK